MATESEHAYAFNNNAGNKRLALVSVFCIVSKNNQHDDTCGLSFIFRGSRHSFSTCFELSGS